MKSITIDMGPRRTLGVTLQTVSSHVGRYIGPKFLSLLALHLCVVLVGSPATQAQSLENTRQEQGLQRHVPDRFALVGGSLHIGDGTIIEDGVLLVDAGKITGIGSRQQVAVPAGWQAIDISGKNVYPGLIDAYVPIAIDPAPMEQTYWNPRVRPEVRMASLLTSTMTDDSTRRSQGIVAALFAPAGSVIDGQGVVANLGGRDGHPSRQIIGMDVGQHAVLTVSRRSRSAGDARGGGYPSSPMGAVALARQAMLDAQWYRDAWQVVKVNPKVGLPETNVSLEALGPLVEGDRKLFVQASNELATLRADRFAREFNVGLVIVGSGREYRRLDDVKQLGRPIICPLDFPPAPNVATVAQSRDVTLESLLHWDHAPENPARLVNAQVEIAFTSAGLDSPGQFLKQVRTAVSRGLDPNAALTALTKNAAKLLDIDDQLGSLENGKLASLLITDGDLFDSKTKILETWVDGKRYEIVTPSNSDGSGQWKLAVAATTDAPEWTAMIDIKSRGSKWSVEWVEPPSEASTSGADSENGASEPPRDDEAKAEGESTTSPAKDDATSDNKSAEDEPATAKKTKGVKFDRVERDGSTLGGTAAGPALPITGVARWNLIIDTPESEQLVGRWVWGNGVSADFTVTRVEEPAAKQDDAPSSDPTAAETDQVKSDDTPVSDVKPTAETSTETTSSAATETTTTDKSHSPDAGRTKPTNAASFPVNYPLGMYGRESLPVAPTMVLFKDFVVWTSGPAGILEHGSVLVKNGSIQQVFADLDALTVFGELPAETIVIEGNGRHLSPGLIDCHSHAATDSGVNEGSQSITSEVRIGDFVDCNDITIYRQLAGGLTAANVLHGSANPIGGQNQVIKLRWGDNDEALKFREAPQGIKFALGENVKRSNSSQASTRYPGSRMGVEQIIRDAFYNATEYRLRHRQWKIQKNGLPPRIDLELEALVEIINGDRWIHCHSYRQDEILALIRTLDEFQVQIGTFQHILEGYKVADSMAHHGAMASAFADWWAYKLEVADAIPYAGKIMHDQGVVVSFNSDDGELGRRMNHEAAKAVKYGGVEPAEALKFVTLNPAKQLRVDVYVGSLEPGKHADIVVWSNSPLSTLSRVEQTWIDGKKYFDRADDLVWQRELASRKERLIQKILDTGAKMAAPGEDIDPDPSSEWPRYDEYCGAKGQNIQD